MIEKGRMTITRPHYAPKTVGCAIALNCDVLSGDRHFHPLRKRVVKTWKLSSFEKTKPK